MENKETSAKAGGRRRIMERAAEKCRRALQIIRLVQPIKPLYLPLNLVQNIIASVLPFINMYMSAVIIDGIVEKSSRDKLIRTAVIMVAVNMLLSLIRWAIDKILIIMRREAEERIKQKLMEKGLTMDYQLLEKQGTADLLERARRGEQQNGGIAAYLSTFSEMVGKIITIVYSLIILGGFVANVKTGAGGGLLTAFFNSYLCGAVLFVLLVLSCMYQYHTFKRINDEEYNTYSRMVMLNRQGEYFWSYISNYDMGKVVRIYNMKDMILKHSGLKDGIDMLADTIIKQQKLSWRNNIAAMLFMIAGYVMVGAKAVYGLITLGDMTLYISTLLLFESTVVQIYWIISNMKIRNKYYDNYSVFLNMKNEKYDGTLPIEKRLDNEYELEFRNVSFHYPNNDNEVLKNITARIRVGGKLAIVGRNGSGKSTFIKLLCRLYDPTDGAILLNGIDIRKYDYDEYRDIFGVVFQDFKLFSFSIAQNVAAGEEYDRARVRECLEQAGIWQNVEKMEHGMEEVLYKLDDDGVEISGGEAQKIAIARALYKDAPVVILDEPTAALDPVSELDIYERFDGMVDKKTAIYISHRMSSCRFCENILVFDDGKIIEHGSHDRLLEKGGLYSELWNAQAQYYN